MSQVTEDQKLIRLYRQVTGETEVEMHKVARFALDRGMTAPKPQTAEDIIAKRLSKAARQEMRTDHKTGRPYRVNHAVQTGQSTFWVDIDEAPRKHMHSSTQKRREQMVGDALQLTFDVDHWNAVNTHEEPIEVALDFTFDVELRKASDGLDEVG
jgi:hypothetical protein